MAAKKKKSTTRSDTSLESLNLYTFFLDRASESKTLHEALRAKGAHVELHREHFNDDDNDLIWLPQVCQREWVIGGDGTGQQKAALVIASLRKMLRVLKATPAPFIAKIYYANRVTLIP
jgi:hypothetical protein